MKMPGKAQDFEGRLLALERPSGACGKRSFEQRMPDQDRPPLRRLEISFSQGAE
jgi:hypothetical protein